MTGLDLKVERIKARIKVQELADVAGRSRQWVTYVEDQDAPRPDAVMRYVTALNTLRVKSVVS